MDFPRGWEIARNVPMEKHDPRCSFRQTKGGILCDCEVITKHPEYRTPRQPDPPYARGSDNWTESYDD